MVDKNRIKNIVDDAFSSKIKVVTEESAKDILVEYGIRVPEHALVSDSYEVPKKARQVGFPLVAKIVSSQILHKTDVKGVKTDIKSEEEASEVFMEMYNRLKNQYDVKGVLLEKMAPPGI